MDYEVKKIQAELNAKGYDTGGVDGIAGFKTLRSARKAIGLSELSREEYDKLLMIAGSDPRLVNISPFSLSEGSIAKLKGVDERLQEVVQTAVVVSSVPFVVIEGVRTKARQAQLVKSQASQTLNSKHIYGKAVDLAPLVQGKVSWDWNYFYPIAEAMAYASKACRVAIRWGGAWVRLDTTRLSARQLVANYVDTRRRQGRKAFTDGAHFELWEGEK